MGKFIIPILLVTLSFGSYFLYTKDYYEQAKVVKADVVKLRSAQEKLTEALKKKDKLAMSYNALDTSLIDRLEKLMPSNLDNIKLIIDVDRTAKQYGMILNAVKFDVDQQAKQTTTTVGAATGTTIVRDNATAKDSKKDYNEFSLTMTVTGTFANFTKLISDMEKNLRIVDITSITFDAQDSKDVYKFEIKSNIYWLK